MEEENAYSQPLQIYSKLEHVLSYKGEVLLLTDDIEHIKSDAFMDSHLYNRELCDYIVTTLLAPRNNGENDSTDEDEEEEDYIDDDYRYKTTLASNFVSKYRLTNFENLYNIVY